MIKSGQQSLPLMLLLLVLFYFSFCSLAVASRPHFTQSPLSSNLSMPHEALALLAFKAKADPNNHLLFSPFPNSSPFHFCEHWPGVQCIGHKVVRLVLQNLDLGGVFAPNTLSLLDQLRVLSLQNNSLSGPIPDLSGLVNLKSLFLDHNHFTGFFPPSVLTLHRLRTLDLSQNNISGPLPTSFSTMDRFYYLRLDGNRFSGSIPPLNQSALLTFNVSNNNLTGAIPVTPTLLRFEPSSFASNPGLCGEIIHKECHLSPPFFVSSIPAPPPAVSLGQSAEVHRPVENLIAQPYKRKRNRTELIIGFCSGVFVLVCSLLCFMMAAKKNRQGSKSEKNYYPSPAHTMAADAAVAAETLAAMQMEQSKELEEKVKKVQGMQMEKSGSLIFCAGEAQLYSLDQLMRASAELMGRGTIGTTYKAVLDNRLIVSVKRLDATKMERSTTKEVFERHMESVGGLRHPNLVPLRAYFQAKEERLLVYDYQPNGSLFSLIHGSKSSKARPLHWTSCLKIAEDVAQGLSYIHQAWRLVHGNLKSSNVLLGPDFEACITDYCLSVFVNPSNIEDNPDCAAYRAPENRNSHTQPSPKSDVYAFGVLLLELLTGKTPSQHPVLAPHDMVHWVKSVRNDDCGDESRMGMLLELASACSVASPELRPTMWLVLKMLQEIKETVLAEDIQN